MATARRTVKKTTRAEKEVGDAVASVALLTPKSAMDKLNAAKLAISDKLAEVDAAVLERIQEMQAIDLAIAQRKKEIKELHEIEVTAETLDAVKLELETFKAEADAEKAQTEADHNEIVADRQKSWTREEADHKFEIAQRNKRDEDMLKAESEARQRAERIRMEDVNRSLTAKIEAVEEREKKVGDLEAQVAALPAKLEEGIKSEVAKATESLKTKYEHAALVASKDASAQVGLLKQQIEALQAQNIELQKARGEAVAVAEKARQELNQIAREAVQASSGREALAAVQSAPAPAPAQAGRSRS